jgi:hypothetical protein
MTLKFTDLQQKLKEAKEKKVVFSFGRMNPPTAGHEKLANAVSKEAKASGADARIYLSHTQNNKKDPLTYRDKVKYAKKAFGSAVKSSRARTIIEIAKELEADGYTDITLVFGDDREGEMVNLIKKYNGKEFNFNSISSKSAGKRDPNAKGVEGISGTLLRDYAKQGNYKKFAGALASKLSDADKKAIYNEIRKVFSIKEDVEFERIAFREAYLVGDMFNVGDIVVDLNLNEEFEIIEQGTNFLYCKGADGNVHTKWLSDLTEKKSAKDDDTEVRQDKDIADKDGTQPAKYFAGLKSKSTKSARDAHFKKGAEKSDDDPSAYKPAPGDATAKTKPSAHTKKFKAMFGEASHKTVPAIADYPAQDGAVKGTTPDDPSGDWILGDGEAPILGLDGKNAKEVLKKTEKEVEKTRKSFKEHLDEQATVAFEVEVEGVGTMLVAGANKQEVQQRLQKMFRDARKFTVGKRLLDPQIKLWYRTMAKDVTEHDSRLSHYEEDELREFFGKKKKPVKQSAIQKVLQNIETNRDTRPKDVKLDGGKIVKVTPEVARELIKFVNKKSADGERLLDLSKFDVFSKVMKQLKFPIAVREEDELDERDFKTDRKLKNLKTFTGKSSVGDSATRAKKRKANRTGTNLAAGFEIDEEWNIDLFLEEENDEIDVPDPEEVDDEELEKALEKIIDDYDDLEDMGDVYPDKDGDGIPDDQDDDVSVNDDSEEVIDEDDDSYEWVETEEALTPAQRFKRAQIMRKNKGKIARARKIALRRMSSPAKIKERAKRHARNLMRKRFTKGKPYSSLGFAQKTQIEKFIAKKQSVIQRIAIKLMPKLRKLEMQRMRNRKESFEAVSPLIESNEYRVGSEMYYETFNQWKKEIDINEVDGFDKELLESDIGSHALYEGQHVPLDCPMMEEDKQPELNKPKAGGPKKYYVYVKDPSSGNIKKVSWGDTTGLKIKLNDPEARKSFAARHQCDTKKDKTKPGYWACRMPYFAKQLGLSGGGNYFW